jgi:hypothetical protein
MATVAGVRRAASLGRCWKLTFEYDNHKLEGDGMNLAYKEIASPVGQLKLVASDMGLTAILVGKR